MIGGESNDRLFAPLCGPAPEPMLDWNIFQLRHAANSLPELKSMSRDNFIKWLDANRTIYGYFRKFAKEAMSSGRKKFSVYMIRERVRWFTNVEWKGDFKVSNNVTPYIGRLLIMEFPQLEDVFSFKGPLKKEERIPTDFPMCGVETPVPGGDYP